MAEERSGAEEAVPTLPPKDRDLAGEEESAPPPPPKNDEEPQVDLGLAALDLHEAEQPNEVDPRLTPYLLQARSHYGEGPEPVDMPEEATRAIQPLADAGAGGDPPKVEGLPMLDLPEPISLLGLPKPALPAATPYGTPKSSPVPAAAATPAPAARELTMNDAPPELNVASAAPPPAPSKEALPLPSSPPGVKVEGDTGVSELKDAPKGEKAGEKKEGKPAEDQTDKMLNETHVSVQAMGKALEAILQNMMEEKAAKAKEQEEIKKLDEARTATLDAHHRATVAVLQKEREVNAALIKALEEKVREALSPALTGSLTLLCG